MSISSERFFALAGLLKKETAVVLDSGREYLIEARLTQIAYGAGFDSLTDMIDQVLLDPGSSLSKRVLLALTTAETSFFRDAAPFEALKNRILPEIIKRKTGARDLSIWSVGCASGQELYSVAILLAENFPELHDWDVRLVGSDINPSLLIQAKAGTYSAVEANRGLSPELINRYLISGKGGYQIRDEIRQKTSFYERNILDSWFPFRADIILCRNTLIYFDIPDRIKALRRFHRALNDRGYLLMGTAESTRHLHSGFSLADINGTNIFMKAS